MPQQIICCFPLGLPFRSEFLGKIGIPLFNVESGKRRWYALKDKKLRCRAKGSNPQIQLELTLYWNAVRAAVKTLNPKDKRYMAVAEKFKRQVPTVKLHERGPLLQTVGHPFPLLLGQPSSALLSTAQAGGPPSVKIGWATKTIIFEDVRGHKMTPFFTCKFFGQFAVLGICFSPCLLVKII